MRHWDTELVKQNRGGRKKTEKGIQNEEWDIEGQCFRPYNLVPVLLPNWCKTDFQTAFGES